jgi:hypothetical protein
MTAAPNVGVCLAHDRLPERRFAAELGLHKQTQWPISLPVYASRDGCSIGLIALLRVGPPGPALFYYLN